MIHRLTTSFCFLFLLSLVSCFLVTGKDEELTMVRKINSSKKLRLDGYYIRSICNDSKALCNYQTLFLFESGITFWSGTFDENGTSNINKKLNQSYFNKVHKIKFNWGLYQILGDSIIFEQWYHGGKNYAYTSLGVILNDTTFVITGSKRSHRPKEGFKKINEIYHFVEFYPKPDSTTTFID